MVEIIEEETDYGKRKSVKLTTKEFEIGEKFTFKPKGILKEGKSQYGKWYLCELDINGEKVTTITSEGNAIWGVMLANANKEVTIKKVARENKKTGNPYYTFEVVKGKKPKKTKKKKFEPKPFPTEDEEDEVMFENDKNEKFSKDEIIETLKNDGIFDDKQKWIKFAEQNKLDSEKIGILYEETH